MASPTPVQRLRLEAAVGALATLAVLSGLPAAAAATEYSPPHLNESYVSETHFDDKGMGLLYGLAVDFLRAIQQPDPLPPNLLTVRDGHFVVDVRDPGSVAAHYAGVIAVLAAGLLVALLLPLAACCCGCCRRGKFKKSAPCVAPLLLGVLTGLALCFAAVALIANAYLNAGVMGLKGRIGVAVSDVRLFISNAQEEADTILETNYMELSNALSNNFESRSNETKALVQRILDSLPLDLATGVATGMQNVSEDLQAMFKEAGEIARTADILHRDLITVKTKVQQQCDQAPTPITMCDTFLQNIVIPNTTFINQATDWIEKCRDALRPFDNTNFISALDEVKRQMREVSSTVASRLGEVRQLLEETVDQTGVELRAKAGSLVSSLDGAVAEMDRVDETVKHSHENVESFETYRNIGFIVMGVLLLFVSVGTAARLLISGCSKSRSYGTLHRDAWIIGLLMLPLIAVTAVLFLSGLVGDRACQAFREPEGSQILGLVDQFITQQRQQVNQSLPQPTWPVLRNASYYIRSCHENKTVYEILELDAVVKIDEIIGSVANFSYDEYITQIKEIVDHEIRTLQLIPTTTETQLKDLIASSSFNVNFDQISAEIEKIRKTAEGIDLDGWSEELQKIGGPPLNYDFTNEIKMLEDLKGSLGSFDASTVTLAEVLPKLENDLRLGQNGTFHTALEKMLDKATEAENLIKAEAQNVVKLANDTVAEIHDEALGFLESAVNRVRREALRCGPVAGVYDGLLVATCDHIGAPLNAFWASSGVCLLLFVPMALMASFLSTRR